MTGKAVNNEIPLKSSNRAVSSVVHTLKLPNFFNGSHYAPRSSSTFEFANATWCFQFRPKGRPVDHFKKYFDVSIVRKTSEVARHKIFYTVKLHDSNGYFYDDFYNADVFDKDNLEHGVGHFIERRNKQYKQRGFITTNSLELICELLCIDSTTKDRAATQESLSLSSTQESLSSDRDVETLCQDLKELYLNGPNHDLTLNVAGKEFRAHQNILMARSKVFQAMFSHDSIEKKRGVVDIPDCDPQVMEQFLFYIYSGKVQNLNQDCVLGLYYAADKYDVVLLKENCAGFIKKSLSPSNICDVIQFALNHNDASMLQVATEYFGNHISVILPTVEWMSFMKSNFIAANELLIKASKKWDCTKS